MLKVINAAAGGAGGGGGCCRCGSESGCSGCRSKSPLVDLPSLLILAVGR